MTVSLSEHLEIEGKTLQELLFAYHNWSLKSVSRQPRRVHLSNELISHPLYLREKRQIIDRIADVSANGDDLQIYLSDKTDQLNHTDLSLAHLGVHHFHLGEKIQTKGARARRVKGTKSLLFCRIEHEDIYFINIYDHGILSGFLNVELARILANNWPHIVEGCHLNGVLPPDNDHETENDKEAAELMQSGINPLLEIGSGKVYMLPGWGVTTAGKPNKVEWWVKSTLRNIERISTLVEYNKASLAKEIRIQTGINYNLVRLNGRIGLGQLDIYDKSSGCSFFLNPHRELVVVKNVVHTE